MAGAFAPTAKTQAFLCHRVSNNWVEVNELKLNDIMHGTNVNEDECTTVFWRRDICAGEIYNEVSEIRSLQSWNGTVLERDSVNGSHSLGLLYFLRRKGIDDE
jgi:hypothetical protein